ncbi:MAG: TIR domain-containing protein [Methanosarcina barkeri]|nr:TIR domain-containing protein [Methanosarcina sp. ERenArc_MAG2]
MNTIAELFSGNYIKAFLEYFVCSVILLTSILKVLFLVIAGTILACVYSPYSKWINNKIEIAEYFRKPIIAVEPWGSERR